MRLEKNTGTLEINNETKIFRKMKRNDLCEKDKWESWIEHEEEIISYKKTIIKKDILRGNMIIICYFEKNDGIIKFWDLGPEKYMNGRQSKPEGKYTKKMRQWFLQNFNLIIPIKEFWGEIDAFYEPHSSTTSVICTYK